MRGKFRKLAAAAIIFLSIFAGQEAWGQSVQIREHPKVPVTKKTTLKIVKNDGFTLKGKWHMETAEAISISLSSGRQIIVPKSDIAGIYECKTRTNEYFYYGFLIGTVTSTIIIYFTRVPSDDASVFLGAPSIGVFAGLIGAVIGSLAQTCEQYYFDHVPPSITYVGNGGQRRPGLSLRFSF